MKCTAKTLLVLLLLSFAAAAQTESPVQTIRVFSKLVVVPAYVTRNRQPVSGLAPSDFVLLRDGKREQIQVFEEVEEAVQSTIETVPMVNPTAITGRIVVKQAPTILFLDFLGMTPLGWERVHKKLAAVARVFADEHSPVIVLALSWGGLVEVKPLAVLTSELVEAAEQWKTGHNRKVTAARTRPAKVTSRHEIEWMLSTYGVTPENAPNDVIDTDTQEFNKYTMTLAAIEEIAKKYGAEPGRKRLIWISSDIPNYIKHANDKKSGKERTNVDQTRALKSLSDANIAIYPVVSNQLAAIGGVAFGVDSCGSAIAPSYGFIYETGGSVCDDAPDLCVKRAIVDAKKYYLLGFYLHGPVEPGWHSLEVRSVERGVDIRAKQSFIVGFDIERPVSLP